MANNNKYPKQRIPQDLLTSLAISAKDPLYDMLIEADYTMPARTDAPFYDQDYQVSALKTFLGGLGSSSAHYAVDKLIENLESENIIAYLSDLEDAPEIARGYYKKSVVPGAPDTSFVYHHQNLPETTVAENALKTLMHEAFLHGTGGRHEGWDQDAQEYYMQMYLPGSSQEDYPMYGTQEDYDVMELKLLEELKDKESLRDMYFKLKEMLPYKEKDRILDDRNYATSGILEKYEDHPNLGSFLESLIQAPNPQGQAPNPQGLPRKALY